MVWSLPPEGNAAGVVPLGVGLLSVAVVPWQVGGGAWRAGVVTATLYVPGASVNWYTPLASGVVVWLTATPAPVVPVIVRVTPAMPGSPLSCTPLPLRSFHTKLPMVTGW